MEERFSGSEPLYRTADGRIVSADDPEALYLVANPGAVIDPAYRDAVAEYTAAPSTKRERPAAKDKALRRPADTEDK